MIPICTATLFDSGMGCLESGLFTYPSQNISEAKIRILPMVPFGPEC